MNKSKQRLIIKNCQKSVTHFLSNYGKLKHPSAGILSFNPFSYQRQSIKSFRKHRLNIFRKCRQSGISKIAGAFATWFAMFHSNKTILIVSRKNDDAMGFLRDNVVFLYNNLPQWMKQTWNPLKLNEHEIAFPNGSRIQSLTSHPDVLRSHASSLNIIDEAAFIPNMDVMWASGWPTLQHGGSVIVISTTNGIGNWYWSTWNDAEAGMNDFNPIRVNWWDMDWAIEYKDALSLRKVRIAPRDGIKQCMTKEELEKWGAYWSPWLEAQYRALQEKGEAWRFEQEVLAEFIGSGNTILHKSVLAHIGITVSDPELKVKGNQLYVHPISNEREQLSFDFAEPEEGLLIWKKPVLGSRDKMRNGQIVEVGQRAHSYSMGVDIASGKGRDYSAIEVFDLDTMEQVAEMMMRCYPRDLIKYADRIGRWYNTALMIVERNNGGEIVIDSLRYDYSYPRLWRKKDINDAPRAGSGKRPLTVRPYGFHTGTATKPTLNKFLIDYIRDTPDEGYTIYSHRLLKQLHTYVRKRDRAGRDTGKTEAEEGSGNFDDLVIATALALLGLQDSFSTDISSLPPFAGSGFVDNGPVSNEEVQHFIEVGGNSLLTPMVMRANEISDVSIEECLAAFTVQLCNTSGGQKPAVVVKKHHF